MRVPPRPTPILLFLLPAVHVFASSLTSELDDKTVARAAPVAAYPAISALPSADALSKATKDAPVDGLDGKPHEGPHVDGKVTNLKKLDSGIEELRPGAERITPKKLTDEEAASLGLEADGVMDDPNRASPKGNTGTEGGVSAKAKDRLDLETKTGQRVEKIPDPPKEAPPLPQGEQERLNAIPPAEPTARKLGAPGLEKPDDLPDKLHDIPHPVPASLGKDDPLDTTPPKTHSGSDAYSDGEDEAAGVIQPFHSFVLSLTMIIFSEIGDKTFLVAALMAMRHPRLVVFSAAFSALIAMTVLSAVLGHAVPTLLPKRFTTFAAAILFLVFGVKLLREGLAMSPDEGVGEEMKEVEMELEEKEHLARKHGHRKSSISPYALESGHASRRSRSNSRLPAPARSPSSSPSRSPSPSGSSLASIMSGLNNLFSLLLSPAWVQTFVMTFLGEWGDRSQIATIAMAAGQDYWWVTGGAILGHGMCTAMAVIGGRAIAGKVSMRVVTLGGAIAFLAFGVIYMAEGLYSG
ncbi:UPF0016-domain-containing protein [Delitschia confertaspora ATCC 74209]|uniref:UPF0016-domain-containing protein n=1 Tax=Delitschia confertaspora ATCC 74209 TaxID=1513339 RepID=A0A9P4JIQ7_9PLEO|nr:UPF0016-domain-containing protein [Delitschia confertaspora ATCC 74209]